jgi:hypothetical protein
MIPRGGTEYSGGCALESHAVRGMTHSPSAGLCESRLSDLGVGKAEYLKII